MIDYCFFKADCIKVYEKRGCLPSMLTSFNQIGNFMVPSHVQGIYEFLEHLGIFLQQHPIHGYGFQSVISLSHLYEQRKRKKYFYNKST